MSSTKPRTVKVGPGYRVLFIEAEDMLEVVQEAKPKPVRWAEWTNGLWFGFSESGWLSSLRLMRASQRPFINSTQFANIENSCCDIATLDMLIAGHEMLLGSGTLPSRLRSIRDGSVPQSDIHGTPLRWVKNDVEGAKFAFGEGLATGDGRANLEFTYLGAPIDADFELTYENLAPYVTAVLDVTASFEVEGLRVGCVEIKNGQVCARAGGVRHWGERVKEPASSELDSLRARVAELEAERAAAAGELMVSLEESPVGSLVGKLVMANRILRRERRETLEKLQAAVNKHNAESEPSDPFFAWVKELEKALQAVPVTETPASSDFETELRGRVTKLERALGNLRIECFLPPARREGV